MPHPAKDPGQRASASAAARRAVLGLARDRAAKARDQLRDFALAPDKRRDRSARRTGPLQACGAVARCTGLYPSHRRGPINVTGCTRCCFC